MHNVIIVLEFEIRKEMFDISPKPLIIPNETLTTVNVVYKKPSKILKRTFSLNDFLDYT